MNRHNWTHEEDEKLKIVVQTNGNEDWTKNSQLLREVCPTAMAKQRTGKQCRERWYNHLDPHVLKSQWTEEQQSKLFQKHKVYGNKWKQLTKYLPGRTDNDVKNHFYSTLRRSLRRLNKFIGQKNSTSQMRQIKPSVLTFIINHIYNFQSIEYSTKELINSLKQLPELIFKFSSFKPIKQNMNKKIDDSMKQKILSILNLVDEFKLLYQKQKNEEFDKSQTSKLKSNKLGFEQKNSSSMDIQKREDIERDRQSNLENHNYNTSIFHEVKEEQQHYAEVKCQELVRNKMRQFTPIVTIQRRSSSGHEKKQSLKKLLLIPKVEQNLKNQQENCHIRTLSFQEQDELSHEMMPIEEPSMSVHQNSHFFGDLVIIGKHIQPIQCHNLGEHVNYSQIDEILYENYQQ